jgi:hypothetical protein
VSEDKPNQKNNKNVKSNKFGLLIGLGVLTVSQAWAQNLVINGDFGGGNTGFTSDYIYAGVAGTPSPTSGNANTLWDEGTYSVGINPYLFHSSWTSFGDHTTGTGDMLIVNGAESPVTVWQGTLSSPLVVGQTYEFSAWVANLYPPPVGVGTTPINPAQLQFSVGGSAIGSIYTAPGVGVWSEFTATFVAGIEPIAVLDLDTAPNGNDFALDDISIIAVPEPATMALAGLSGLSLLLFRRQRK